MFGRNTQRFILHKNGTACLHENIISKYGEGAGQLAVMEGKINSFWGTQQDTDPKHGSKSTTERKRKSTFWNLPSPSHDLNPIEILWNDLNRAIHTRYITGVWLR